MSHRQMASALVALMIAIVYTGCGGDEGTSTDTEVGSDVGETTQQPEASDGDAPNDTDTGKPSEGNREKIDLSEILPPKKDSEPERASLEGLSFDLRPFKELDGDKVRTEGTRKHYSNSIVVLHGKYTQFYGNGKKQLAGQYKDDMRDGLWTFWHQNGQKSKEGTYASGLADGKWTHWRSGGSLLSEGDFQRGRPVGVWTYYDADGKKTMRDLSKKPE